MAKRDSNFNPLGKSRGVRRKHSGVADWESVDATTLIRAVARASAAGGAIRLGYSRDGGAYAVGIYGDGDPYTEFIRPSESVEEFLEEVIALFDDLADEAATGAKDAKSPPEARKKPM